MNKTKVEKEVDHEQERVDRIKAENAVKRAAAAERVSMLPTNLIPYSSHNTEKGGSRARKDSGS